MTAFFISGIKFLRYSYKTKKMYVSISDPHFADWINNMACRPNIPSTLLPTISLSLSKLKIQEIKLFYSAREMRFKK